MMGRDNEHLCMVYLYEGHGEEKQVWCQCIAGGPREIFLISFTLLVTVLFDALTGGCTECVIAETGVRYSTKNVDIEMIQNII